MQIGNSNTSISFLNNYSPAISWGKEFGNFHEVEMTSINIGFGMSNYNFGNSWQYSYNFRLAKNKINQKVKYYLGTGVSAGAGISCYDFSSNSIKTRGARLNLITNPRMTIDLSEKFKLDINVVCNLYSYWYDEEKYEGFNREPYINEKDKLFPGIFTWKIGIGYKF